MRFKDRVAIISGGGAGMGRATALAFAKEGACVVINDIDEKSLNSVAGEIQTAGGTVTAVRGDVTRSESIKAVVARALETYGRIDILFNYVGGEPDHRLPPPFTEQTETYWRRTIELNLISTMVFSHAVLDSMMKRRYGKIINTAAIAALVGTGGVIAYSAAKGGIIAFTKALAREVAPYNINVNCLCLGPIDTPGAAKMSAGEDRGRPGDFIPLKRVGRPEEVASAVLYLASEDASFITGHGLTMDGGITMV
jgi:2-hydroxycyclohexanecarboxyl-CoA dehydrogenase